MSTGQLQINVFDGSIANPLSNTTVSVTVSGQPQSIVGEVLTNSSGKTDTLTLDAPPVEYSLNPGSPKPYSDYDVIIKKDGFEPIAINGVQILPDAIAAQNVYMKKSDNNEISERSYTIPDHTLYGNFPPKIAEEAVKPLPKASGFVVLDKVVIPEFIVVHDGSPYDDSAPNYWIPYQDYIKNVASSEIYATWPEEAIKANVLVIISFTLNRVFTEWYRSRGKNFTITSSTAYDQKFVYQRNIFQEISNVVDDIFSTFITKPSIQQPLFTQYCDGINVTCPGWLSQWESKNLGEQGEDYINILRRYYGSEIYLESATEVTGIPVSFPGETLGVGSSGDAVRTIQRQLNSISNNYPLIPKLAVDGNYGQSTLDAVKTFQKIFDLPQTGYVDYKTWYEISKVYTAVMRLSN